MNKDNLIKNLNKVEKIAAASKIGRLVAPHKLYKCHPLSRAFLQKE